MRCYIHHSVPNISQANHQYWKSNKPTVSPFSQTSFSNNPVHSISEKAFLHPPPVFLRWSARFEMQQKRDSRKLPLSEVIYAESLYFKPFKPLLSFTRDIKTTHSTCELLSKLPHININIKYIYEDYFPILLQTIFYHVLLRFFRWLFHFVRNKCSLYGSFC